MIEAENFEENFAAIERRDMDFEGSLFFGVKTTQIFCRPSCSARRPLKKNVEFFSSSSDALRHGYRPCKRCRPLEPVDETPHEIAKLIADIMQDPARPIRDQDLRERGLKPATVRRWFKAHHGITFHSFQRMLRLNISYKGLASGQSVTETAFDAGFESLSGFNARFKDVLGVSPGKVSKTNEAPLVLTFERFTTPLGPMMAIADSQAVYLLEFTDRRGLERELIDLKRRLTAVILPGQSEIIAEAREQLSSYFDGKLKAFTVPLETPGTPFQQQVWQELLTIPYGETRSYKAQATRIGNAKAVRAVATANGMNRLAIIIPCHRVIGSDGSLTGYAGGLRRKEWLLNLEAKHR